MEKELFEIINDKNGLIGQHKTYYGDNKLIKEIDKIVGELKTGRATREMYIEIIEKLKLKLEMEGILFKNIGLSHIEKKLEQSIFINKKSILGFFVNLIK